MINSLNVAAGSQTNLQIRSVRLASEYKIVDSFNNKVTCIPLSLPGGVIPAYLFNSMLKIVSATLVLSGL